MAAYVIVDIKVNDPVRYEEYKKMVPSSLAAYGGRFLARGGEVQVLEGDWSPSRVVILEFESIDSAKEWLQSPEYRDARALRHETASSNMVVVAGL